MEKKLVRVLWMLVALLIVGGLIMIILGLKELGALLTIGLVFFAGGILVGSWLKHLDHRLEEIEELRDQLKRRRHTYATADGLDDAQAVIVEMLLRQKLEAEYAAARLAQLSEIVGLVQKGPQKYDGERPNHRPTPPG